MVWEGFCSDESPPSIIVFFCIFCCHSYFVFKTNVSSVSIWHVERPSQGWQLRLLTRTFPTDFHPLVWETPLIAINIVFEYISDFQVLLISLMGKPAIVTSIRWSLVSLSWLVSAMFLVYVFFMATYVIHNTCEIQKREQRNPQRQQSKYTCLESRNPE